MNSIPVSPDSTTPCSTCATSMWQSSSTRPSSASRLSIGSATSPAFLRAAGGENHHDLGLFAVGPQAPRPPRGSTGLYHLAWEVPRIEDLALAAQVLTDSGALGGASDHGVSKSLYGQDPDGNEFEIMWRVPREQWGDLEKGAGIEPLDIEAEVRKHGAKAAE